MFTYIDVTYKYILVNTTLLEYLRFKYGTDCPTCCHKDRLERIFVHIQPVPVVRLVHVDFGAAWATCDCLYTADDAGVDFSIVTFKDIYCMFALQLRMTFSSATPPWNHQCFLT